MNYPNVKLVMKSSDTNGNNISTTIGYVNPNASDGVLKTFAEKLNAFTTNTFKGITKVTTDDILDAEYAPELAVEDVIFDGTNSGTINIPAIATSYSLEIEKSPNTTLQVAFEPSANGITGALDPSDTSTSNTVTLSLNLQNWSKAETTLKLTVTGEEYEPSSSTYSIKLTTA